MKDADTLRTLASDTSDNVRVASISGLSRLTQHTDDVIFVAALTRNDHSVMQAAARALQGSPNRGAAVPALLAALQRLSSSKKDNTRDPRLAILQRLQELGTADHAVHVTPLLADFDPRVAALAAETLTKWTGVAHTAAAVRPPNPAPRLTDLMRLESTAVRITMRTGGTFELRLYPEEAPATVERFVKLARAGYYNGLTFHRVAPNWVIQGGSPGANELSGDSPFMIDEMGMRSHTRGTLGISTRGRDTGDAQIFVNLADNPSLDHTFTVWAEVVKGMESVDAVVEGDVIERIEVGAR
jgi:cyclophilin family peptidyl-prolyl cis-trans isomerase